MKSLNVKIAKPFDLKVKNIASDKSISHRCAIFSLLSKEISKIENFLEAEDTLNSLEIAKYLGAKVEKKGNLTIITPPEKICEPNVPLYCGNAGTAIRLYMGFLASQDGFFILSGDSYLNNRPMARVANPLREIGAQIDGRDGGNKAPISIRGKRLKSFDYESKISSAQVKSALILAALNCEGKSIYTEPELSRDHSENMLKGMGAIIETDNNRCTISPLNKPLKPLNIKVPSDPSSAFFFAVAAAISENSKVVLENILLNKTRIEAFKILEKMGAKIEFIEKESNYERVGDIVVESSNLIGVEVSENLSWLIDEIPALAIAMSFAKGKSVVKNASELRVKESDRIKSSVSNLIKCGVDVKELDDGFEIVGGEVKSATIESFGDHRVAMSFAIAGIKVGMNINDIECINTSFPNFLEILKEITEVETID